MKFSVVFGIFICLSFAQAACIRVKQANGRSGPSLNHGLEWKASIYTPLIVLEKKGKWAQVRDFEGDKAWIHQNLMTEDDFFCGVVKATVANLRQGPGMEYPLSKMTFRAEKYEAFKISAFKNNWAKLEDGNGKTHWAYRKLLWIQQ